MSGNALDRVAAKIGIQNAERGVNSICSNLQIVDHCVYYLNLTYMGGSESKVTKVYYSYHELIEESMQLFGRIFIDYHRGLVSLINAGADGDEIKPFIERHDKMIRKEVITNSNKKGIQDYRLATERVEAIQTAVNNFIRVTDDLIAAYQKLWWLGNDAGNIAIQDKAHEAAQKVRELIENFGVRYKFINKSFRETIEESEKEQGLSEKEVTIRANELYSALKNVDFRTISADQDALQAIASSWRDSL